MRPPLSIFSRPWPVDAKSFFILIASLLALRQVFGLLNIDLILLVLGLTLLYGFIVAMDHLKKREKFMRTMAMMAIGLIFFFRKSTFFLPHHLGIPFLPELGVAYLTLKLVSFTLDVSSRPSENRSWVSFLSYCLFAPTYVAGPIFDYRFYRNQLTNRLTSPERGLLFLQGTRRIILGLFKTTVLSYVTSHYTFYTWPEQALLHMPWLEVAAIMQLTLIDLYFNFSGYTDLAIGVSNCAGLSIPENFNYPFCARNLQDFWNRWHISLAEWFRRFIFSPLYRQLLGIKLLRKHASLSAGLAILATFIFMGLWHGLRLNYLAYGFMHGIGFVVMLAWGGWFKPKNLQIRSVQFLIDLFFRLLTLQYLALALLVFYADNPNRWHLLVSVLRRVI